MMQAWHLTKQQSTALKLAGLGSAWEIAVDVQGFPSVPVGQACPLPREWECPAAREGKPFKVETGWWGKSRPDVGSYSSLHQPRLWPGGER